MQKRKILLTLFEIGLPTFFGLILLLIRFKVETNAITHGLNWSNCGEFDVLPSTGAIPKKLTYAPMFDFTTEIMERIKHRLNLTEGEGKKHQNVALFTFLNLKFVYILLYSLTFHVSDGAIVVVITCIWIYNYLCNQCLSPLKL